MDTTPTPVRTDEDGAAASERRRFALWPLWAAAAGILGMVSSVVTDTRVDADEDFAFPVGAEHMADLDYDLFRVGGFTGYLTVICLVVFLAVWRHRVEQRFSWSVGASVVTFGVGVSAAALTLAYGWKGALGTYGHGRPEADTYDDAGLYTYYVMNDFSPYLSWLGVLIAGGGLAWMAFREGLVSRVLGALCVLLAVGTLLAVGITGVPGLPITAALGMAIGGVWLTFGRSAITQPDAD
ncbi:hypothetical protein GCM10023339_02700 [Alloalcanivorax gelatiniphagus]